MSRFPPGVPTDVWEPVGEPVGTGIVLPGRGYPPAAPGCAYAGYVLRAAGWRVRDVWWDPPANELLSIEDEVAWVGDQLASATAGVSGPVFVVGKSLGTYGARLAAERSYPAIWLTPVLTEPVLVEAIRANPARQLLVGGTADLLGTPTSPPPWQPTGATYSSSTPSTTASSTPPTRSVPPRPCSRSPAPWCGSSPAEELERSPAHRGSLRIQGKILPEKPSDCPGSLSAGARPASRRRCWPGRSRGPRSRPA